MKLTGAEIVCESLLQEGVDIVFGLPGGAVLPLYGAMARYPDLRHVLVRHEQAAAMAADGYARATGRVGVCSATSGPGATNLVTGIATAQMDSVPMVAITGQVPRAAIGRDAFQETDVTGITLPITKHNFLVMEVEDVAPAIKEAFHIARTGRPGPVLVDIPKDVLQDLRTEFVWPDKPNLPGYHPPGEAPMNQVARAADLINNAKRPVIMAGHGVLISQAYGELIELAEKAQIPVITTLLGISSIPSDHVLNMGMPGMHGMAYNNLAIDQADLLIGLGMRFDDRVTGRLKDFAPTAQVVHIDVDASELDKNVKATVPVTGDLKKVLNQLMPLVQPNVHIDWHRRLDELKAEHPSLYIRESDELLPQYVLNRLSRGCWRRLHRRDRRRSAPDVGGATLHLQGAQHPDHIRRPGLYGLRGAGSLGSPHGPARQDRLVGRRRRRLPDDHVRPGHRRREQRRHQVRHPQQPEPRAWSSRCRTSSTTSEYYAVEYSGNPDFVKLAAAYGIDGLRVTRKDEVDDAVRHAMEVSGPVIIDFVVKEDEQVYPWIPAGESVHEMIEEQPARGGPY